MLRVENANHLLFFNNEYRGGHDRGSRPDTNILACQATLTKKVTWSQRCYDSFLANLIDSREPHTTFLNVHDALAGIALRKNGLFLLKFGDRSCRASRIEKSLGVERSRFS